MTGKIELIDILPTEQEIVNYGKCISTLNLEIETPYTITDEELTQEKLNEYDKYCQENDVNGDYLLASLITARTFELNKGNGDDN